MGLINELNLASLWIVEILSSIVVYEQLSGLNNKIDNTHRITYCPTLMSYIFKGKHIQNKTIAVSSFMNKAKSVNWNLMKNPNKVMNMINSDQLTTKYFRCIISMIAL